MSGCLEKIHITTSVCIHCLFESDGVTSEVEIGVRQPAAKGKVHSCARRPQYHQVAVVPDVSSLVIRAQKLLYVEDSGIVDIFHG